MRINARGQVTIPARLHVQGGLLSQTDVEFIFDGEHVVIRRGKGLTEKGRGAQIVEMLRGVAGSGMTTDEIMALTRGD